MNQIKLGALISYLHRGISIIITFVYTPVMIRLLGESEYGLYNTVASTISILSLLSLGFENTYIKYYTVYHKKKDIQAVYKLNGIFLCVFSLIAIIAVLCGVFLSDNLTMVFADGLTNIEYKIAKKLMLLLSINMAATLFTTVFRCIITAREQFVFLKLVALVRSLVSPLVSILILLCGFGSVGMVITTVMVACACDILHVSFVVLHIKEKFIFKEWDLNLSKDILWYTLLIAVHLIVDQINWNVDKVLLGRYKGTAAVALYSVGYTIHSYYIEIGITMTSIFVPRVHKMVSNFQNDKHQLMQNLTGLFTTLGRIQFFILAPIAVGFLFWGKPFLGFWVGPEYIDAYYVALLLMIPGSVDIIQNIGIEIQRALGLHGFRAAIYAVMAVINVLISAVLCQKYGAVGCAVGTAISLILVQGIIMNVYYYKRCYLDIPAFWKSIISVGKGLILPVCFGLVMCNLKNSYTIVELLVCLSCFVLIYIVSMFWLGMTSEERKTVNTIWKNRR